MNDQSSITEKRKPSTKIFGNTVTFDYLWQVVAGFVAKVGFPIAVATYLLLSLGNKIDKLTSSQVENNGRLDKIIYLLERK